MEPHRTQVRRILDYLLELAGRDFDERRNAIFADHSTKDLLKSGATIRRVVRAMEEVGAKFVSDAAEKVSVIAQDTEAFAHLQAALEDLWLISSRTAGPFRRSLPRRSGPTSSRLEGMP